MDNCECGCGRPADRSMQAPTARTRGVPWLAGARYSHECVISNRGLYEGELYDQMVARIKANNKVEADGVIPDGRRVVLFRRPAISGAQYVWTPGLQSSFTRETWEGFNGKLDIWSKVEECGEYGEEENEEAEPATPARICATCPAPARSPSAYCVYCHHRLTCLKEKIALLRDGTRLTFATKFDAELAARARQREPDGNIWEAWSTPQDDGP